MFLAGKCENHNVNFHFLLIFYNVFLAIYIYIDFNKMCILCSNLKTMHDQLFRDFSANQQRHVRPGQFADSLCEVLQHCAHQWRSSIEPYALGTADLDQQSHSHLNARRRLRNALQCLNATQDRFRATNFVRRGKQLVHHLALAGSIEPDLYNVLVFYRILRIVNNSSNTVFNEHVSLIAFQVKGSYSQSDCLK